MSKPPRRRPKLMRSGRRPPAPKAEADTSRPGGFQTISSARTPHQRWPTAQYSWPGRCFRRFSTALSSPQTSGWVGQGRSWGGWLLPFGLDSRHEVTAWVRPAIVGVTGKQLVWQREARCIGLKVLGQLNYDWWIPWDGSRAKRILRSGLLITFRGSVRVPQDPGGRSTPVVKKILAGWSIGVQR